jgi:pimeloyl-ACP methyl ester carboxylesterase
MQPVTQYAKSGDVHIAYQSFGGGPINLVMVPGFVSNVENYWDEPDLARFLNRLGSYARVVTFDKRGTGMSDRGAELPGLDQRMYDLRAVMDAAGMEQAALARDFRRCSAVRLICRNVPRPLPRAGALRQLFAVFLLVSDRGDLVKFSGL